MKDSPGLHLKTYILILFMVLFAPLGNVLLSKGMKAIGSARNWGPGDIFHILLGIITSGCIWLGLACLLTFFFSYLFVLTWAYYSYVTPASAFYYFDVDLHVGDDAGFLVAFGNGLHRKREFRSSGDCLELRGRRRWRHVVLARTHQPAALARRSDRLCRGNDRLAQQALGHALNFRCLGVLRGHLRRLPNLGRRAEALVDLVSNRQANMNVPT